MRIASGSTDKKVLFVAKDATDFTTNETGLSSFTVYRSRNGGTATAYTTPTIAEIDATNMPGLYSLVVDEDTTITSGDDEESYILRITHAGMAPVTIEIELYRPKITEGETVGASSGAVSNVTTVATTTTNSDMRGTDSAATAAALATAQADLDLLTGADGAILATTQANYAPAKAGDAMALTSGERTTLAAVIWNSLTSGMTTVGSIGKKLADWTIHSAADVWSVATRVLTANTNLNDPTAAAIADAVWTETLADHSGSSGSTAEALNAAGAAGDPWTTALPGAYGAGSAGNIVGNLNDVSSADVQTAAAAALAAYDPPTRAEATSDKDSILTRLGSPAGASIAADIAANLTAIGNLNDPTAAAIADAVWDEAQTGHTTAGTFGKYLDTEVSGVSGGAGSDIYQVVVTADLTGSTLNYLAHLEVNGQQVGTISSPSVAIYDKDDSAVSFTTSPSIANTNVVTGSGSFSPTSNVPYAIEVTLTYGGSSYVGRCYMGAKT